MEWKSHLIAIALCVLSLTSSKAETYSISTNLVLPSVHREFRAAWVASVSNIDWPSKRGLTPDQQRAELVAILDRAALIRLNAIILQVRPMCDAFYASTNEPWSEYLTGKMGQAPQPFYDPLAFAVEEAHKRGLELHAWFNPYRAGVISAKASPVPPSHISKQRPDLVRRYGKYLWLDPGEPDVQAHSLRVIQDVVARYDIDGVHIDDYFYPYPEKDAAGNNLDFPDNPSWQKYLASGGKLTRNDWRRDNVNVFVKRLYETVKQTKSWVKFGVSPFGIWRPGTPATIRGLDQYELLYADARLWFHEGWLDYFTPQLYWAVQPPQQSYPVLLRWWNEQNLKGRHLWPGMSTSKVGNPWKAEEILQQIQLTRAETNVTGNVHWSVKNLMLNRDDLAAKLMAGLYVEPALIPASPWLEAKPPESPAFTVVTAGSGGTFSWSPTGERKVNLWLLQTKARGRWFTEILPGDRLTRYYSGAGSDWLPEAAAISAVDRFGNVSQPVVLSKAP